MNRGCTTPNLRYLQIWFSLFGSSQTKETRCSQLILCLCGHHGRAPPRSAPPRPRQLARGPGDVGRACFRAEGEDERPADDRRRDQLSRTECSPLRCNHQRGQGKICLLIPSTPHGPVHTRANTDALHGTTFTVSAFSEALSDAPPLSFPPPSPLFSKNSQPS